MRRVVLLLAAVALLVVALPWSAIYVYSHYFGVWPQIRRVADTVQTLPGHELVERTESGGEFCVISCEKGEPHITLALKTRIDADEACRDIRAAVGRVSAKVRRAEGGWSPSNSSACAYSALLPDIHSDAFIGATTEEDIASADRPENIDSIRLARGQKLTWIVVVSGIE